MTTATTDTTDIYYVSALNDSNDYPWTCHHKHRHLATAEKCRARRVRAMRQDDGSIAAPAYYASVGAMVDDNYHSLGQMSRLVDMGRVRMAREDLAYLSDHS